LAFRCSYCHWNSKSISLVYDTFEKVLRGCKNRYRFHNEKRNNEIKRPKKWIKFRSNHTYYQDQSKNKNPGKSNDGNVFWNIKDLETQLKKESIDQVQRLESFSTFRRLRLSDKVYLDAVDPEENGSQQTESSTNLSITDSLLESQISDTDNLKKEDLSNIGIENEADVYGLLELQQAKEDGFKSPKSDVSTQLDAFLASLDQNYVNSSLFENTPIKIYDNPASVLPIFTESISLCTMKCPYTDEPLISYESYTKSFKIKYSSTLYENSPTIKMQNIHASASLPGTFVYLFNLWNFTKKVLKLTLTINDEESKGAAFSFRDNKKEMRFVLYKKDQYQTNPELKFKEYMELLVKPFENSDAKVQKEVIFDTEFTYEGKQLFVLKGKYVF
jgi:hypothetical protein